MGKNGLKLQTLGEVFADLVKKVTFFEKILKKLVDTQKPLWYSNPVAETSDCATA